MRCLYEPDLYDYGVYSTMALSEDNAYVDDLAWTLLDGACQDPPVSKKPNSWDFETEEELQELTKGRYPSSPPKAVKAKEELTQTSTADSSVPGRVKSRIISTVRRVTRGLWKATRNLVTKPFSSKPALQLEDENPRSFAWSYDPVRGEMQVERFKDFYKASRDHSSREEEVEPFRKKRGFTNLFQSGLFGRSHLGRPEEVKHLSRMTSLKQRGLAYVLVDGKFEKRLF
jgi:hypothetical protein